MSLVEYNDITLYELTILIEGYNVRWEEQWRHTRRLYTLLYNINSAKKDQRREEELMPFPSELEGLAFQNKIGRMKFMAQELGKK